MLYDLVIYRNDCSTDYINIKGFLNDSSLQGIVDFTNTFTNRNELLEYLFNIGVITYEYIDGVFKIHSRRGKASEPKLIPYGLSYEIEKKFFSLDYLANYYVEHIDDEDFITSFLQKYYNYLRHNPRVNSELYQISFCRTYYKQFGYYYDEHHEGNISRKDAMRNFVYKYAQRTSKGQNVINILTLRDLAMFAINYNRDKTQNNPEVSMDNKENSHSIKDEIRHYKQLLSELSPFDEAYEIYQNKIEELEQEIGLELVRRKENETTEY